MSSRVSKPVETKDFGQLIVCLQPEITKTVYFTLLLRHHRPHNDEVEDLSQEIILLLMEDPL